MKLIDRLQHAFADPNHDAGVNTTENDIRDTQSFMRVVDALPADEREQKIQKWHFYKELARRQGIVEAEQHSDNAWR